MSLINLVNTELSHLWADWKKPKYAVFRLAPVYLLLCIIAKGSQSLGRRYSTQEDWSPLGWFNPV